MAGREADGHVESSVRGSLRPCSGCGFGRRWRKLEWEKGEVTPGPLGADRRSGRIKEQHDLIHHLSAEKPDISASELQAILQDLGHDLGDLNLMKCPLSITLNDFGRTRFTFSFGRSRCTLPFSSGYRTETRFGHQRCRSNFVVSSIIYKSYRIKHHKRQVPFLDEQLCMSTRRVGMFVDLNASILQLHRKG